MLRTTLRLGYVQNSFIQYLAFVHPHQYRAFSSTKNQPPKILPFRISTMEARQIFLEWAQRNPLGPHTMKDQKVITNAYQIFLPFYVFSVTSTSKFNGEVGRVKNGAIQWSDVTLTPTTSDFSSSSPTMQVFSSYTYKSRLVQVIKSSTKKVKRMRELRMSDIKDKMFDEISMKPDIARQRILEFVKYSEQEKGEKLLAELTGAAHIKNVRSSMSVSYTMESVYFPAIIIEYNRFGRQFRCFVNGYDGRIFGQEQYSAVSTSLGVTAISASLLGFISWSIGTIPPFKVWLQTTILPSFLVGLSSATYPLYKQFMRERKRIRDKKIDESFSSFDREQAAYDEDDFRYEQHKHRKNKQEEEYQRQYQKPKEKKIRKYYTLLGVSPNATLAEIKAAFRKLAFQYHPDLKQSEIEKKKANEIFKEINKAYQTLRDPKKRSLYDLNGKE